MMMVPSGILPLWFLWLWFYGLIAAGVWLLRDWHERAVRYDPRTGHAVVHTALGWGGDTALLVWGVVLLFLPTLGGLLILPVARALCRKEPADEARGTAFPAARGTTRRLRRADGTEIQVEWHGPEDGPPVVLTHGWGTNRTEWEYLRRDLDGRGFRLITWDLPGLGDSDRSGGGDYSLERFAADLDQVMRETCGGRPAVLAGHSIGGMTTLTFCRDHPEALGTRVAGLILVDTTYTDPVRTCLGSSLLRPLERPLLVPLQYLTILLSPLLFVSNWMSYFNGAGHVFAFVTGFAGTQSWQELDTATRYTLNSPPGVIARGMLGMMRYDATQALKTIPVPTLIVSGDKDVNCRHEASETMAREIPRAQLLTLSPGNHMALFEHRRRFAEAVGQFLTECLAPTPRASV